MSAAKPPAPGLYPPLPTFLKLDNWTVDYDTQAAHTKFLVDNGIKGFVINGSTGENAHLSRKERANLVKTIRTSAGPESVVIAGIAENSVEGTIEEIKSVKNAGADYVLVVTSNYFGASASQEGIYHWFKLVADASPLPVLIYLYPGVTNGIVIQEKTFEKLAQHPNIVGSKFTHGDLTLFIKVQQNPIIQKSAFSVFPGFANLLLPAFSVGSVGLIDGLGNAFPKTIAKLLEYGINQDFGPEARELQYKVTKAEQVAVDGGVLATKLLVKSFTGFGESFYGRPPLDVPFSKDLFQANYVSDLEELAAIEKTL